MVFSDLPNEEKILEYKPETTVTNLINFNWDREIVVLVRKYIPLKEISPELRKAVVISEDDLFFRHSGINMNEVKKAFEENLEKKRFVRGASTITMQLARNAFLFKKKTITRKLKEIIMKTVIGPRRDLPGTLNLYNVEFGNIRSNLETFFQFQRLMDPTDINKLKDVDSLTNVVAGARASIEAAKDKAISANAEKGTEFFKGNFKFAEDGSVARDEEGLPEFQSEDGWVIAAAHKKGAACLLGKKFTKYSKFFIFLFL